MAGEPGSITFLNVGGIFQHDLAEIPGGVCAVNVAFEPLFHQVGQVPTVINVRMAEDDSIKGSGIEREMSIPLQRFLTTSLIKTTVQQNPLAINFQ